MSQPVNADPLSRRKPNPLLAAFALAWLGLLGYFLYSDIAKVVLTDVDNPDDAAVLQAVKDTSQGWFPAARDPFFNWEDGAQGWTLSSNDAAPGTEADPLRTVDAAPASRGRALSVPVNFPDPATICRENIAGGDDKFRMAGIRFISYDVWVPRDFTGYIGCLFFLKDKDGLWYQARSKTPLLPGRWTTVAADMRGESPDITPLGHLGQWDENQATRVRAIGITFYGDKPNQGQLLLDNFRGWVRPQRFEQILSQIRADAPPDAARAAVLDELAAKAREFKDEPLKIINLRTDPGAAPAADGQMAAAPVVKKIETFTVRFELNRQAENPFDPELADIRCQVQSPSGQKFEHTGFWHQDYDREDRFEGDELLPMGRPEWRVRITPREEGEYKYSLVVRMRRNSAKETPFETVRTAPRKFTSVKADNEQGFLRVSKQDSRWFEFENGEFFYPIGHNLHSPIDLRCWNEIFKLPPPGGRGLPMYRDFFGKMRASGENVAEVWMSSWWLGIEWTSRWRNFYGHGRYSLQNAWKLDYLLNMARQHGIHIHLVLDNHGKFSSWCDWEWDLNPYNKTQGGSVGTAREFFTDPWAKRLHRNRLRYIAARWGCDPAIMGWELVSEYDLVGGVHRNDSGARSNFHRSPILRDWAREMIAHLREYDVYNHPVTNHYATDYNYVDADLACSPTLDYIVTDAYRQDRNYSGIANRTQKWARSQFAKNKTQKPFWITEFGGDCNATAPAALEADTHCGLWATWMTDGAGTPLLWWYDFVDRNNLYTYYRAFANYARGEDRRGINGSMVNLDITDGGAGDLRGSAYIWNRGAYAWVYSNSAMQMMPPPENRQRFANVKTSIDELDAGEYRVEYWDCYQGTIAKSENLTIAAGESLPLHFPPFVTDMALKVKRLESAGGTAEPAGTPATAPELPASTPAQSPPESRRP
jgi:hypothetical protein